MLMVTKPTICMCVCVSACIRLAVLNRLHARFGLSALSYAFPGISPWLWSKFSGFFSTQTHTRMRGIHPYLERLERFLIPAGSDPYLRAWWLIAACIFISSLCSKPVRAEPLCVTSQKARTIVRTNDWDIVYVFVCVYVRDRCLLINMTLRTELKACVCAAYR